MGGGSCQAGNALDNFHGYNEVRAGSMERSSGSRCHLGGGLHARRYWADKKIEA